MQPPSTIEFDNAQPPNKSALDAYYCENLSKILKSPSKPADEDDDSLTASDSDLEECYSQRQKSSTPTDKSSASAISDNIQNKLQNIHSVGIGSSSGIHFGTKAFYHGPVTIKQILVSEDDAPRRICSDGVINRGFDGCSSDICANNKKQVAEYAKDKRNDKRREREQAYANVDERKKFMRVVKVLLVFVALVCVLAVVVPLALTFCSFQGGGGDGGGKEEPFCMISRPEWNAEKPSTTLKKLQLPIERLIIAHTVDNGCFTKETCIMRVQSIQNFHMNSRGFSDIGYNFLIGGDGNVYEGRGWLFQGAHTASQNNGSIGIAFIGTFSDSLPNDAALKAGFRLFDEGVKQRTLAENYRIFGAAELSNVDSPGRTFLELIKTWKHWHGNVS